MESKAEGVKGQDGQDTDAKHCAYEPEDHEQHCLSLRHGWPGIGGGSRWSFTGQALPHQARSPGAGGRCPHSPFFWAMSWGPRTPAPAALSHFQSLFWCLLSVCPAEGTLDSQLRAPLTGRGARRQTYVGARMGLALSGRGVFSGTQGPSGCRMEKGGHLGWWSVELKKSGRILSSVLTSQIGVTVCLLKRDQGTCFIYMVS